MALVEVLDPDAAVLPWAAAGALLARLSDDVTTRADLPGPAGRSESRERRRARPDRAACARRKAASDPAGSEEEAGRDEPRASHAR
ncbi:hypothetical protein [Salana multivorans]